MKYFTEYYVDKKFIGSLPSEKEEDREIGYFGKRFITITEEIVFSKTKKIKANTEVMTIVYPLNV